MYGAGLRYLQLLLLLLSVAGINGGVVKGGSGDTEAGL